MAKVKCGTCKNCGPKTQAKVQAEDWEVVGKTKDEDSRVDLAPKDSFDDIRSCPEWAVVKGPEDAENPVVEAPPKNIPTWVERDSYGLKCRDCGSRRGEDHCASCPNNGKDIGC
jgi:hypothetical protein